MTEKVLKCFFWCHKKKKISYFLYTERQQTEWRRGVWGDGVGGGGWIVSHSEYLFPAPSSRRKDVVNQCLMLVCVGLPPGGRMS